MQKSHDEEQPHVRFGNTMNNVAKNKREHPELAGFKDPRYSGNK